MYCQQICCNEFSTLSTLQHTTNYNNIDPSDNHTLTAITSNDDVWTPIISTSTSTTTTNSITRLHRINDTKTATTTTKNDDDADNLESPNDVTTHFDIFDCSSDTLNSSSNNYLIETFAGDIVVTIILHQSDNATTAAVEFIVKRINEIGVLAHNVTIGEFYGLTFYSLKQHLLIIFF